MTPRAWRKPRHCCRGQCGCDDAYSTADAADAVVIVTEWNEFRLLDLERVKALMKNPIMVDLRNIYKPTEMANAGFSLPVDWSARIRWRPDHGRRRTSL